MHTLAFRSFYRTAVISMLTLGVSWGVYLLYQLSIRKNFTGLNLFEVNAHGQAQIIGWISMMIMGSLYLLCSRSLAMPYLIKPVWILFLVGMVLSIAGLLGLSRQQWVLIGGLATSLGALLFVLQMTRHLFLNLKPSPVFLFLITALFFFLVSNVYAAWHHFKLCSLGITQDLLWQVATYQAPLRDLQVHGVGLFMVFAILMWVIKPVDSRWAYRGWVWLISGVVLEVIFFLLYRHYHKALFAALLLLPWASLFVGSFLILIKGKLFSALPLFARLASVWLFISLSMLLLMPLYSKISHLSFSHAYYGAIRHAVTVGFLSQMIFGMSFVLLKRFFSSPVEPPLSCFIWLNLGCFARVLLQILSDFTPVGFSWIPLSGLLEFVATVLWAKALFSALRFVVTTRSVFPHLEQGKGGRPL